MPYIKKEIRQALDWEPATEPSTPGELTYVLYKVCNDYYKNSEKCGFARYAEVLGCLEACKLELYRRRIAPYEDDAIARNGDIK